MKRDLFGLPFIPESCGGSTHEIRRAEMLSTVKLT